MLLDLAKRYSDLVQEIDVERFRIVGASYEGQKREGEKMGLQLHIPESVLQSIRLPEERMAQELLKELALAL